MRMARLNTAMCFMVFLMLCSIGVSEFDFPVSTSIISEENQLLIMENYLEVQMGDKFWCTIVYDGKKLVAGPSGNLYDDYFKLLTDTARVYAYVLFSPDGVRKKFAMITWIGPAVGVLKKAKVSTDKAFVKEIFNDFNREFLADRESDIRGAFNYMNQL